MVGFHKTHSGNRAAILREGLLPHQPRSADIAAVYLWLKRELAEAFPGFGFYPGRAVTCDIWAVDYGGLEWDYDPECEGSDMGILERQSIRIHEIIRPRRLERVFTGVTV